MIKQCGGSLGRLLKMAEQKEQYFQIENLIKKIEHANITQIWNQSEVLYQAKEDIIDLLEYMSIVFYEQLKNTNFVIVIGVTLIEQTKKRILANANYDMSIDYLLLKLWEEFD